MPLIIDPKQSRELYDEVRERGALLLNLGSESRRATEAVYKAVYEFGRRIGVDDLPVVLSVCGNYEERPQLQLNNHLRDVRIGLEMFMADARLLSGELSPYRKLRVMAHLDHAQPDLDHELLTKHLDCFSSVMFDASTRPLDENIRMTAQYVEKYGGKVMIEGAVDELVTSGSGEVKNEPTSVKDATHFIESTGVDLIVPNVGTEHRAAEQEKQYLGQRARELSTAVGKKLVLHGSSSLKPDQYTTLADDGIIKMNYYTGIVKDGAAAQIEFELENINKCLKHDDRHRMMEKGLIAPERIDDSINGDLEFFGDSTTRLYWIEGCVRAMHYAMEKTGYERFAR